MAAYFVVINLLLFLIFIAISTISFVKVNEKQPDPYMDEIFHVPQAQLFCDGNFSEVCTPLTRHLILEDNLSRDFRF